MRLLKDPDVTIRRTTLDFMENLGDSAVEVIPALIEALGDSDRFVRWAATRMIGELPPENAQTAVPGLARLLSDPDLNVRQAAAASLEAMGKYAAPASNILANALLDGDTEIRTMVMGVLIRIPPQQAKVAVPQLIELLSHADPRLRKASAETLGRIGPPAQPAVAALRRLLGDDNADVRTAASDAILAILVVVNPNE
jgi:HEAT repeat protein